jgi:hypothetical protein
MPVFASDYNPTHAEMARISCVTSKWMSQDQGPGYWSGEAITVVAAYVLLPALALVLVCGFARTLGEVASGYVHWLKHGGDSNHGVGSADR